MLAALNSSQSRPQGGKKERNELEIYHREGNSSEWKVKMGGGLRYLLMPSDGIEAQNILRTWVEDNFLS